MVTPKQRLVLFLRVAGFFMGLAIVAVFMPQAWHERAHRMLGLGEFPRGPVVEYLARGLSGMYALIGGLCLLLSSDVRRYAPVITYLGVLGVFFGPCMLVMDIRIPMPTYWIAMEGTIVTCFGLITLALQYLARERTPEPVSAASDSR